MTRVRTVLLGLMLAGSLAPPSVALAQETTTKPKEILVAPEAPKQVPEPTVPTGPSAGKPADICAELVSYLQLKQQEQQKTQQQSQAPQPSQGQQQSQTQAQQKTAPESAGQSGAGTAGPGQSSPPVDRPQQQSGLSAPIPPADTTSRPPQLTLAEAEQMQTSGDVAACHKAARQMRRAGVALPPGLIALAALPADALLKAQPPR